MCCLLVWVCLEIVEFRHDTDHSDVTAVKWDLSGENLDIIDDDISLELHIWARVVKSSNMLVYHSVVAGQQTKLGRLPTPKILDRRLSMFFQAKDLNTSLDGCCTRILCVLLNIKQNKSHYTTNICTGSYHVCQRT